MTFSNFDFKGIYVPGSFSYNTKMIVQHYSTNSRTIFLMCISGYATIYCILNSIIFQMRKWSEKYSNWYNLFLLYSHVIDMYLWLLLFARKQTQHVRTNHSGSESMPKSSKFKPIGKSIIDTILTFDIWVIAIILVKSCFVI